jgi:hypothetical protein
LSSAQLLYQLQILDSDLDQTGKELTDIKAALGETDQLVQAKAAVQSAEESLRRAKAALQTLDLEVTALAGKISQQEKLLYSGKAMSAKEAANLQDEVASLKRRHQNREEALLEAMVSAEEAGAGLTQARAELAAIQAQWQADQQQLRERQTVLQTKAAELKAQRKSTAGPIDPKDLANYENLRRRKAGRAVVMAINSVCQGCGVAASSSKLQRARAGVELLYCSTCGRILYVA